MLLGKTSVNGSYEKEQKGAAAAKSSVWVSDRWDTELRFNIITKNSTMLALKNKINEDEDIV